MWTFSILGTCNAGNPHFLRRARHAQNVAGRNVGAKRLDFCPIRWLTKVVVDWTRGLADSPPASQVVAFHAGLPIVWELTEELGRNRHDQTWLWLRDAWVPSRAKGTLLTPKKCAPAPSRSRDKPGAPPKFPSPATPAPNSSHRGSVFRSLLWASAPH